MSLSMFTIKQNVQLGLMIHDGKLMAVINHSNTIKTM